MTLAEAATQAEQLAQAGSERELAQLRQQWADEIEGSARAADYRDRAAAYRAIGQFRFRQKLELLRRGLEDGSPACRGAALLSVELLSREHPAVVNSERPRLHRMVASKDENAAVRRLAVACLKNGSPQRETIVLLNGVAEDDEEDSELRSGARRVADVLRKRANVARR